MTFKHDRILSLLAHCGVDSMLQIMRKIKFHDLRSDVHVMLYVFKYFHLVALILSFK